MPRENSQTQKSSDIKDHVILVTGAGSGFGRSMSVAFCRAGARVYGVGRREERLSETARLAGPGFTPVTWDLTRVEEAPAVVEAIVTQAGSLHALVNNAAVLLDRREPLSLMAWEDWDATWRTNVSGVLALARAAFAPMRRARYGRVVNLTSGLGFRPMLEYGSYCVAKAAVNMMTRVLALDGRAENVLVNAIEPGVARTEMNTWASESPDTILDVAFHLVGLPNTGPTGRCFNKRVREVPW